MEDKKNKRKLFKRIGAIVGAVVVAIVAFSLPFLGNFKPRFNSKNMVASADEVSVSYSFVSSDLYHFDVYSFNNAISRTYPVLFSSSILYTDGELSFSPNFNYISSYNGLSVEYNTTKYFKNQTTNTMHVYGSPIPVEYGSFRFFTNVTENDVNTYNGFFLDVYSQQGFNANVYKVRLYTSDTNTINTSPSSDFKFLNIEYYDLEDDIFRFSFIVPRDLLFNERFYFLVSSENLTDNQLYNQGYSFGYSQGVAAGEVSGYSEGFSSGEVVGYNNGYSAGANAAGTFTFFNLISAVIDAPIQAFMGLFNFELLGINLAGFFTGLLTLAFIFTIVRLVMP